VFSREKGITVNLESSCVLLAAGTLKGVNRRSDPHAGRTDFFQHLLPGCRLQTTGNSSCPEIDVVDCRRRHRLSVRDIGELENAIRPQHPTTFGNGHMSACSRLGVSALIGLPPRFSRRAVGNRRRRTMCRRERIWLPAIAPSVIRRSADGLSREVPEARLWGAVLTAIPLVLALVLGTVHMARPDLVITIGLCILGFAFAVISSLHSYLILAYAGSAKAAEDVGFCYAANAGGRLVGILLSGVLTQVGGLAACLWGSATMLALCLAITFLLPSVATARRIVA
jgi:hypothetical protein